MINNLFDVLFYNSQYMTHDDFHRITSSQSNRPYFQNMENKILNLENRILNLEQKITVLNKKQNTKKK